MHILGYFTWKYFFAVDETLFLKLNMLKCQDQQEDGGDVDKFVEMN